jgi:hypothetical protein
MGYTMLNTTPIFTDTEQKIQNVIDSVQELTNFSPSVVDYSSGAEGNIIAPSHALRILCVGVHMVTHSTARTHTTQWTKLFRTLTDLVHESMQDACSLTHLVSLTSSKSTNESLSYYTAHLTQTRCLSHEECIEIGSKCLEEIQLHDRRSGLHLWNEDTQTHQSQWASAFKTDGYAFQDELVEMLATIYFASGGRDVGDSEWWRVKQLGIKRKVRVALAIHMDRNALAVASSGQLDGNTSKNIVWSNSLEREEYQPKDGETCD